MQISIEELESLLSNKIKAGNEIDRLQVQIHYLNETIESYGNRECDMDYEEEINRLTALTVMKDLENEKLIKQLADFKNKKADKNLINQNTYLKCELEKLQKAEKQYFDGYTNWLMQESEKLEKLDDSNWDELNRDNDQE